MFEVKKQKNKITWQHIAASDPLLWLEKAILFIHSPKIKCFNLIFILYITT